MINNERFEVAVIGGGPAGSTTALTLAQAGHRVLLVEKTDGANWKVGEGLPPSAKPLLHKLGVMSRFLADGHLPSYGNASAWGTDILQYTDFINSPNGQGWHLERSRFDAMLREAARDAGAITQTATYLIKCQWTDESYWQLTLKAKSQTIQVSCQWLVDGTGRTSWVTRRLGIKRQCYDRLMACVALFQAPDLLSDRNSLTLVESTTNGWWYTAILPSQQRIVVYHTDADLETGRQARSSEGFISLLAQTKHIFSRLTAHNYIMVRPPKIMTVNSARLELFLGERWLAVGDAAISFDPLSSQGIFTSLYGGLKAGQALNARLNGDSNSLLEYSRNLNSLYEAYLHNYRRFYAYESRWLKYEFWQRRQGKSSV